MRLAQRVPSCPHAPPCVANVTKGDFFVALVPGTDVIPGSASKISCKRAILVNGGLA